MTAAHLGDGDDVVNCSGVRRPGCGDYAERFLSRGNILLDCSLELGGIELQLFVHRNSAQRLTTEAEQAGRLVQRVMCLYRGVQHWLRAYTGDAVFNSIGEMC